MNQFLPKSPTLQGTGKLATKTRELEKSIKRLSLHGVGVSSGPLGTWITSSPKKDGSQSTTRAYWA